MPRRVIYSYGGGREFRELFASLLMSQLLVTKFEEPLYIIAPALADVVALDNTFRQTAALLPAAADRQQVWLSEVLSELARRGEVRLICARSDSSKSLINRFDSSSAHAPSARVVDDTAFLPNGMLGTGFFLEGHLRFATEEPMIGGERIVLHTTRGEPESAQAIAVARERLDKAWSELLATAEDARA